MKKINNGKAPSALNFYKVQSSFIDELSDIKSRTHFAKKAKVSFDNGPYLVFGKVDGVAHIDELETRVEYLLNPPEEEANGVAKLRQWSAELHKDKPKADFMIDRMEQVNKGLYKELKLKDILKNIEKDEKDEFKYKADSIKFGKVTDAPKYKSIVNDLIILSSFKTNNQ